MKLEIRRYRPEDATAVDEIYNTCHRDEYNLPNLDKCIELAVVLLDGKVVALGAFEIIPELTLVLDNESIPKRYQVAALKELLDAGDAVAKLHGFNEVYAFPDSKSYGELLKKHFNFEDCEPILVKRFKDG